MKLTDMDFPIEFPSDPGPMARDFSGVRLSRGMLYPEGNKRMVRCRHCGRDLPAGSGWLRTWGQSRWFHCDSCAEREIEFAQMGPGWECGFNFISLTGHLAPAIGSGKYTWEQTFQLLQQLRTRDNAQRG